MNKRKSSRRPDTAAIRIRTAAGVHREHTSPIYLTSSFSFDDAEQARALFAGEEEGHIYSRFGNPNVDEFIDKMCRLETCEDGVAFASGMSAIFSSLAALLGSGDHVIASRSLFGSTHQILSQILPAWGIVCSYGNLENVEDWDRMVSPTTRVCLVETPSNPCLDIVDIKQLHDLCSDRGIVLMVDNVFATPVGQRPAENGADLVVHSATKYIDGQGRALGGVVVGKRRYIDQIRYFARHTGPSLSPFHAWMFSKSLETLSLRMEKHAANALELAQALEQNGLVSSIRYPFLPSHPQYALARRQMSLGGGIVSFELEGGQPQAFRFMNALKLCTLTANLGDTRTIATHPASTTHRALSEEERLEAGITQGLIRVSVGLEDINDILEDVQQAVAGSVDVPS